MSSEKGNDSEATHDLTEGKAPTVIDVRFQPFFESYNDAMFIAKPDGTILVANPAAQRIFGMTEAELMAAGRDGITVKDDRMKRALDERSERGTTTAELTFRRGDGSTFPGEITSTLFKNADNSMSAIIAIRNITERKQAEEALKQSEARYRGLFENTQAVVFLYRLIHDNLGDVVDVIYVDANSMALRFIGQESVDQIVGRKFSELYSPEYLDEILFYIRKLMEKGSPTTTEVHSNVTGRYSLATLVDLGQNVVQVTAVDITERKRVEEALRKSEEEARQRAEELKALMDVVPATIWITRDPTCLTMVGNKATEELLRAPKGANVSKSAPEGEKPINFRPYRGNELIATENLPLQAAARTGKPIERVEFELQFDDGRSVWLYGNAVPLLDSEKRTRGSVGAFMDISERKKMEEALRESREDLNRAQEVARTGSWRLKLPSEELLWSDTEYRIFGVPIGTPMTYQKFLDIVHPDDRGHVDENWAAGMRGEQYDIEHRIVVDGEVRWVRERAVLEVEGGVLKAGFGTTQDISDRKRAEDALKDSEARFRSLIEEAPVAIAISCDGMTTYANRRYLEMFGIQNPNQLYGRPFTEQIAPGDRDRAREFAMKFASGHHDMWESEFMGLRTNGSHLPFHIAITTVMLEGRPAILGFFSDITERKLAEDRLKGERERLFEVLDNVPAMVCLITPDHRIAYANRLFKDKFGESNGRPCYEYCYQQPVPCTFCESFRPLETGKPHHWQLTKKDGTIIDAYDVPFTDVDGSPMILEMDLDITEQVEAQREVKEYAEKLKRSNEELQQFAYVASHDLQEPLRMVMSYIGLLNKKFGDELPPQAKEYMSYAVDGSTRMKALIDDLLQYSRIDSRSIALEEINMNEVMEMVEDDLHVAIKEAGAEVGVGPLPTIRADKMQMKQLLTNLLTNAIKFHGDSKPRIEVSAVTCGNDFVFAVKDNGIGIDPKYTDKLFKMFQRLHTRDEYPGTGIGLAISKKIVERHGGRIRFESEPGKGTTFFFSLPSGRPGDYNRQPNTSSS